MRKKVSREPVRMAIDLPTMDRTPYEPWAACQCMERYCQSKPECGRCGYCRRHCECGVNESR